MTDDDRLSVDSQRRNDEGQPDVSTGAMRVRHRPAHDLVELAVLLHPLLHPPVPVGLLDVITAIAGQDDQPHVDVASCSVRRSRRPGT